MTTLVPNAGQGKYLRGKEHPLLNVVMNVREEDLETLLITVIKDFAVVILK